MDDLVEVYSELNILGSASNEIFRTLGKGAASSLVYGPVYKQSHAEKRDFDTRVELEVEKATSAMKIEMVKKLSEEKKEMELMDKKLVEAKEDMEAIERKLSKAKIDMEANIVGKVKTGKQAYLQSFGITISENIKSYSNERVSGNSIEDCQKSLSPVSVLHAKKDNMVKKTETSVVGTNKKKWVSLKRLRDTLFFFSFSSKGESFSIVIAFASTLRYVCFRRPN